MEYGNMLSSEDKIFIKPNPRQPGVPQPFSNAARTVLSVEIQQTSSEH